MYRGDDARRRRRRRWFLRAPAAFGINNSQYIKAFNANKIIQTSVSVYTDGA